ncbi:MAG: hypothetical protein AAB473_02190 [Patescibacteria group bacterium]
MPSFENTYQIRTAVRGILSTAPDKATVKHQIQALPGPMLSQLPKGGGDPGKMRFGILGEIVVHFYEDGSRSAAFTIATEHDDPNPELVSALWTPEKSSNLGLGDEDGGEFDYDDRD